MNDKFPVGLPNGHTWVYRDKKKAEKAAIVARALAAMPIKVTKAWPANCHTNIAKYGQQWALAKALDCHHLRIYNLLVDGNLPRSLERRNKLLEIAATMPDDWFEKCKCLDDDKAEHAHVELKGQEL